MKTLFKHRRDKPTASEHLIVKESGDVVCIQVSRQLTINESSLPKTRNSIVIPNDKALELAQSLTQHLNNGWISAKDRLSTEEGYYLIIYDRRRNIHQYVCWFYKAVQQFCSHHDQITHWQPLPAPPSKDTQ